MNEEISSDSDYELIQSNGDLKNENEMENKNVLVKPENPKVENEDDSNRDDTYCEICNRNLCNRYFLKIHIAKKHGIGQSNENLKQVDEMENKNILEKPEIQIIVEELKQTFQQMIDEIKIENSKQNSVLKEIIEQKNGKIICLGNKVKQVKI
uniref:C2H2-type domain-containing protein n=1 Tax=Meloidogyne javanica TaxID=6303 RepID=A0A915LYY4_MELJA